MQEKKYSKVHIRKNNETKKVRIGSNLKPEISNELIEKWQSLLDLTARIINVPAALIMRLHEDNVEVFLRSQTNDNPYYAGKKIELIYGIYCETVIGKQKELSIPDAGKSELWKKYNPAVDLNMVSYLGFPVNYPDGEVFGTVCVLDNKENHYNELYKNFMDQIRQHIETDLELLVANHELEQSNEIKTKFLSLISHDARGSVSALDEFVKLLIDRFNKFKSNELLDKLKIIRVTTNSLYETLQNLLSWSKNDLLHLQAQKEQVDLINVIKKILDFLKPRIEYEGLSVLTEYESDQMFVFADPNMLAAALRNIISNAIKFSGKSEKVIVRVYKNNGKSVIEIEDTGVGMDENTLNNLFNFSKSEDTEADEEEGSRIGLMLTKEFLDKNDATIKVSSKKGEGTKFVISL